MNKIDNEIFTMFYLPERRRFVRCSDAVRAFLQYKSFRIDLLSGDREEVPAEELLEEMEREDLTEKRKLPKVFHLFYEFGHIAQGRGELVKENIPLAISIEYRQSSLISICQKDRGPISLEVLQYPSFEEYQSKFNEGMERLLSGDCYQFNLTFPFFFGIDKDISAFEFIAKAWENPENIGAYAHCTYLGTLNKLFFSNSPECLFQAKGKPRSSLYSMPIKGTMKARDTERGKAWKKLKSSAKDQGELYMITDLLRNDLTKVQMNPARIVAKKLRLDVPGIVHQYSLVEVDVDEGLNLSEAIKALFPGGSVTGAPKKRVMEILNTIEGYERGFYCGSTVILHKSLKAASINIRSCEMDCSSNELKYCAGGGVTLKSDSREEFEEALSKMESFLRILKK